MNEKIKIGEVIEGKVTGIKPFGAFVALDEETQGMVHISEVSNAYVKNINDFLKVGETVKVKVLSVDEAQGKIGLSIKATLDKVASTNSNRKPRNASFKKVTKLQNSDAEGYNTLEQKLKEALNK